MHLVCPACGAVNRVPEERLADGPTCGKCHHELAAAEPVALADSMLETYLAKSDMPVLIDFWADWCGPCRMMAPQFEAAAALAPDIRFIKVDSDASPMASRKFNIRSIPTLLLWHRNREVGRQSGVMSSQQLVAWVRERLQSA